MSNILGFATLLGVLAAVFQLSQVRKQRIREFEDLFVVRYWAIMDRLSVEGLECIPPEDRSVVSCADRAAVLSYLRLSEDERHRLGHRLGDEPADQQDDEEDDELGET